MGNQDGAGVRSFKAIPGAEATKASLQEQKDARRLALHGLGMNDPDIARAESVSVQTIIRWRAVMGLSSNRGRGTPISAEKDAERMALYRQGLSDRQIGKAVGARENKIHRWRQRRGLPTHNPRPHQALTPEENATRMLLYQMRYSDPRIAREQGVAVGSVAHWRKRRGLPAHGKDMVRIRDRRSVDTTLDRIKRAIGRRLPPDIADDAVGDLYLAVAEGRVNLERIEAEARRVGNQVLNAFASKFGPRSLDEELGDEDGFRMIDMIRDDRSSSWLEEMGATVW